MCGGTLFKASARLSVPSGIDVDDLRHALEALADELMVEVTPENEANEQTEITGTERLS